MSDLIKSYGHLSKSLANFSHFLPDLSLIILISRDHGWFQFVYQMNNLCKFYCQSGKVQELWYDESGTYSIQIEPTLIICREKILVIKCEESFEHLGKTYNFDMNCKKVRKIRL